MPGSSSERVASSCSSRFLVICFFCSSFLPGGYVRVAGTRNERIFSCLRHARDFKLWNHNPEGEPCILQLLVSPPAASAAAAAAAAAARVRTVTPSSIRRLASSLFLRMIFGGVYTSGRSDAQFIICMICTICTICTTFMICTICTICMMCMICMIRSICMICMICRICMICLIHRLRYFRVGCMPHLFRSGVCPRRICRVLYIRLLHKRDLTTEICRICYLQMMYQVQMISSSSRS